MAALGELQVRALLLGAGFSAYDIDYDMTLSERDICVLQVMHTRLEDQQRMSLAMTAAVASVFSGDAAKRASQTIEDSKAGIMDVMYEKLGLTAEDAAAEKREAPRPGPSRNQVLRDIGKLNAIMSSLTGSVIVDPYTASLQASRQ